LEAGHKGRDEGAEGSKKALSELKLRALRAFFVSFVSSFCFYLLPFTFYLLPFIFCLVPFSPFICVHLRSSAVQTAFALQLTACDFPPNLAARIARFLPHLISNPPDPEPAHATSCCWNDMQLNR